MLQYPSSGRMSIPAARGTLSGRIAEVLTGGRSNWSDIRSTARRAVAEAHVLISEDVQLSLFMLYELHYRGLVGVSDRWEWDPDLLAVRAILEAPFERELRQLAETVDVPTSAQTDVPRSQTIAVQTTEPIDVRTSEEVVEALFAMTAPTRGPSLSRYMAARATKAQFREFLTQRSVYHLKEADPHSWAIPRLGGRAKAALVEVQADEYGGGRAERMHATLFGDTMRALDLDATYGALVDKVPAVVLAVTNAMSMFGLHRRLLGAIVGHLAAFEMTSSLPNRLYGNGLRRLGLGVEATRFFDEHVEADAVHEQIAGRDLVGSLLTEQPERVADVLFGARACLALDNQAGDFLLHTWQAGQSSLRAA